MSQLLQEFADSRGVALRVDRATGVIRGIKILGLQSRNGRRYLPEALARAAPLYEGAKVNVNHPKGDPRSPRDYQERIGVVRNVHHRAGQGLFGDLHFNPKHPLAEQLTWDAEHAPENVGFSHNVEARLRREGEAVVVEAIVRVHSVDLVADPATTRGLFESTDEPTASRPVDEAIVETINETIEETSDAVSPSADLDIDPEPVVASAASPTTEQLLAEVRAELAELRAALASELQEANRPQSRDQYTTPPAPIADARSFAKAIL